eukprot:6216667-Prorocentrum_lima.AAC.1
MGSSCDPLVFLGSASLLEEFSKSLSSSSPPVPESEGLLGRSILVEQPQCILLWYGIEPFSAVK